MTNTNDMSEMLWRRSRLEDGPGDLDEDDDDDFDDTDEDEDEDDEDDDKDPDAETWQVSSGRRIPLKAGCRLTSGIELPRLTPICQLI